MGILGDLKDILALSGEIAKIPSSRLHAAFAYLMVPGSVVLILIGGLAFNSVEEGISIIQLESAVESTGSLHDDDGLIIILDSDRTSIGVPLTRSPRRSFTSLPPEILSRNKEHVRVDLEGIELSMPLLGAAKPFVVYIPGKVTGDILLPGKRTSVKDLELRSKEVLSLATWCLFPVMIGLGLVVDRYTLESAKAAEKLQNTGA